MAKQMNTLNGHPFLEKEAAPLPSSLTGAFSNLKGRLQPNAVRQAGKKTKEGGGTFVTNPADSVSENARLFNTDEVTSKADDIAKGEGTGSFMADGLLGLTKRVVPAWKEPIEKGVLKGKQLTESADTAAGGMLAGNNPASFRGKLFSSKVSRDVGEVKNADGTISRLTREDRRPSMVAPVQNTTKFVTPLLGAAYVGEKMYPTEEIGGKGNPATYENELPKQSNDRGMEKAFDKSLVYEMDKRASMQKIAELEGEIAKYASDLEAAHMEKLAVERERDAALEERNAFEKRASEAEHGMLEKKAEFEELRLRTIAQERSKTAVDLAEELLEKQLIKQAEFDSTVDSLMDSDERTIKLYQNMVKEAENQVESLESLSILGEYKVNEKLATEPNSYAPHGLSRRGQTIGEAARDLKS